ncbi:MAG: 2-hydroxyacyl-CoA dehydratase family protein, partial [Proteobacteria bacterium]|nr:2-hydroxyacyl-CoA dehydratase family protein [Pseudomonadota bacterium]
KLLKLCEFDEAELLSQKERIERAFQILELGPADMEIAEARIKKYFDTGLLGVRKAIGVWFKELFDLVLSREEGKKIIYYGYPPFQYIGLAIKAAAKSKNDFYVGCPEAVISQTLGQFFHKLLPVLEAGEDAGLPPGHAMCSLLQVKVGALEKGIIPVPDLSIATSYFCDMGPKSDELLQYKFGYPVEYIDSCLDSAWGTWPEYDHETVRYLGAQLDKLFCTIKDKFAIEINDETWQQGRLIAGRLYSAINKLTGLLAADPVPLSVVDSELILNFPIGCTGSVMDEGAEAIEILAEEVKKRVENGFGVAPKESPRVLIVLHSISDPVVNRLIEDAGLAVPSTMALLPPPPEPESYPFTTLGEKRAEKAMFGGAYHSTYGMVKRIQASLKYADVDGIIYNYPFACRPFVCGNKLTKLHIENETGLPTLLLDMDPQDERYYSIGALRTRLETFAEMLRARKAAA